MSLVIALSGKHGVGKSTYASILSKKLGLRHVSAGVLFREIAKEMGVSLVELSRIAAEDFEIDRRIDERTKEEASKGCVVLEGRLVGWMAREYADLNIYLSAPDEVRFRRVAERDGLSYEEARRQTLNRERLERERYLKYYGIDVDDLSIYDIVLNTAKMPIDGNARVLVRLVEEYRSARR